MHTERKRQSMRRVVLAGMAGVLGLSLLQATSAAANAASSTCDAVAHHEDASHDGFSCTTLPTVLTRKWVATLNGAASYPLIEAGKVFVTTSNAGGAYGGWLYALNAADGSVAWGPVPLAATYYYFTLAYDNGHVFVNDFDGKVRAFDADTGAQDWATETSNFSGEPVATHGVVWLQGSSAVYGLSEHTGEIVAQSPGLDGDGAAVAVNRTGVYVSTGCESQYKLSPTGSIVWSDNSGCSGGGGGPTAIHRGLMYGGDGFQVLDQVTGDEVSSFAGTPAFVGRVGFFGVGNAVFAENVKTGVPMWTSSVNGTILAGPVATSTGIYVATSHPSIVVLDPTTGMALSHKRLSGQPGGGGQFFGPPSDMAAGDSLLVVPTGAKVTAFG